MEKFHVCDACDADCIQHCVFPLHNCTRNCHESVARECKETESSQARLILLILMQKIIASLRCTVTHFTAPVLKEGFSYVNICWLNNPGLAWKSDIQRLVPSMQGLKLITSLSSGWKLVERHWLVSNQQPFWEEESKTSVKKLVTSICTGESEHSCASMCSVNWLSENYSWENLKIEWNAFWRTRWQIARKKLPLAEYLPEERCLRGHAQFA